MRAWASPPVPSLAEHGLGHGELPRVFDTASGQHVTSSADETARLYVCGITPYDATHLGHAATYLAFDQLQRVWRDAGLQVTYTQNVTDIDDPLLERAARDGLPWRDLAARELELFRSDMVGLRVLAPDHLVGVTESMQLVIEVVERLSAAGATYELEGDVYFDVRADPSFGEVGHLDTATMRALSAERGGDPDRGGKRDPLDCLLWLAERPGEPAWESPFGRGRPGWHTECVAIAEHQLGRSFDVQGGGSDLVFPHHEMSAAQARVAFDGHPFARAYVHAGMVGLDGEKMSKSRGNLVLVSGLLEQGHDPTVLRLALLAHHYRSDWSWTDEDLATADKRLSRWRDAAGRDPGSGLGAGFWAGADDEGAARHVVTQMRSALADDLDAPGALEAVDAWASAGGGDGARVAAACDALLGIDL